jgi:hypothetical protein
MRFHLRTAFLGHIRQSEQRPELTDPRVPDPSVGKFPLIY